MLVRDKDSQIFPPLTWDHGWSLSLQAARYGYASSPSEQFNSIDEYDTVEAVLYGPFPQHVDPRTMDLPKEVAAKFTVATADTPAIGHHLTKSDIEALKTAILAASLHPNHGVPTGRIGWPGKEVFHGCSLSAAQDIEENGILMDRSFKGYLGQAFYVTPSEELARDHYADFSEDEGAVIRFFIKEDARILDLRNLEDSLTWTNSGLPKDTGADNFAFKARQIGIDGVFDRSFDGVAIYNPNILEGYYLIPESKLGFR